jgi:hypothetical protein
MRPSALLPAAVALLAGCATFEEDVHLSPFFSNLSMAGGGREFEALAGAVRVRRPHPGADVHEWAWRPWVSKRYEDNGDSTLRFLVPLGKRTDRGDESVTHLLPVYRYQELHDEQQRPEWRLLIFPLVLWSQNADGRVVRAFFPFGGVIERFLTYDEIVFAAFPVYMRTKQGDRESTHFLWPFFCWSKEREMISWRFWPFYGVSRDEDHTRRFVLWPFFHWHENELREPPERQESKVGLLPFYGITSRGSYRSHVFLWPFFGWASDPESGFKSYDGPWPLVRIQRPGTQTDVPYRTRVWPFYSYYQDDKLESTWIPWPLYNQRVETYDDGMRRAQFVIPFYQNWIRTGEQGEELRTWTKLWPLYQEYTNADHARTALPALNPLWHTPVIDDHYAWLYELYTREVNGPRMRERVWGNVWRRDVDDGEERTYLSGLWSRRKYRANGDRVRETSLLLGLVRWREDADGVRLMRPAMPGPGWPAERLPEVRAR